jgi:hypothetical protein
MKAIVCEECLRKLPQAGVGKVLSPRQCDCCGATITQGLLYIIDTPTFPPVLPEDEDQSD